MGQALPLIGLAISAAGTGLGVAASAKAKDRMDKQLASALQRQDSFAAQGSQVFKSSLGASGADEGKKQVQEGQTAAQQLYERVQALPQGPGLPAPQDATVDARTQQQISLANLAAAGLQGYPNMSLQQWMNNQNTQNQLGVISNLSNNAASILPYQLQGAQASTADMAALGSLLGTGGSLLGMYGATKDIGKPGKPGK